MTESLMCANPFCVLGTERFEIDEDTDFNPKVCAFCTQPLKAIDNSYDMPVTPSSRKRENG